jgi:putative ribosome biogenesis GTPase RsgA
MQFQEGNQVRILITGAGGFAGRHLLNHLITTQPSATLFGTVYKLEKQDSLPDTVQSIEIDLRDEADVYQMLSDTRPDAIYHLAAQSSPSRALDSIWPTLDPSGAGKSSLLNAVQPGLGLRVGEISRKVRRGTNTTVAAVMIPLERGGYLVDTPGFSEVGLWGVEPRELASCFPEMRPFIGECRFGDCRHLSEPKCAVRAAVERGEIAADRHQSYVVLLGELDAEPKAWE